MLQISSCHCRRPFFGRDFSIFRIASMWDGEWWGKKLFAIIILCDLSPPIPAKKCNELIRLEGKKRRFFLRPLCLEHWNPLHCKVFCCLTSQTVLFASSLGRHAASLQKVIIWCTDGLGYFVIIKMLRCSVNILAKVCNEDYNKFP
jgi:hypothetical protein